MHPHLQKCRDELLRALEGLSPADADAARPGTWSIANIVEHLDLTFTRNAAGIERRLAKPDAPARVRTFRQAAIRHLILKVGYFPTGRKSPDMVVPQGRLFADVAGGLDGHFRELDRIMQEGERVLGAGRAVLDHPVIGPFSIDDWRKFHLVHTRHHLKQIARKRRQ